MSTQSRVEFLHNRTLGVGGSSAAAILSDVIETDYACKRRAWYEYSQIPPDYPDAATEVMRIGTLGERFVARSYAKATGREVEEVGLKKHDIHASMQVHADRIIHPQPGDAQTSVGVLEVKLIGRQMMRKIQDTGIINDYLIQLMMAAECWNTSWGAFAVAVREDILPLIAIELAALLAGEPVPYLREPKIVHFDLPRHEYICEALRREIPRFWSTLGIPEQAPERLLLDDPKCQGCRWELSCQGRALTESVDPEEDPKKPPLMPEMLPFIEELRVRDEAVLKAEEQKAEQIEVMKTILGSRQAVSVMMPDDDGKMKRKNLTYRVQAGARRLKADRIVPQYNALRAAAIEAGLPGAELAPVVADFYETGMPSRPFRTASVLKAAKKAFVPEQDGLEESGE